MQSQRATTSAGRRDVHRATARSASSNTIAELREGIGKRDPIWAGVTVAHTFP